MSETSNPPKTATPPRRNRAFGSIVLVLFTGMMGARVWLQRKADADRERMMRSLMENSRKIDQEVGERMMAEAKRREREDAERRIAELEELRKKLVMPSLAGPRATSPEPEKRTSAVDMPHSFVVTHAHLAWTTIDQAPAKDFRDRAVRKELIASLAAIHAELKAQLGDRERFPDPARVAALRGRVEEAIGRIDGAMRDGTWKKMAIDHSEGLRGDMADFAAAVAPPDGGVADARR